MLLSVFTSINIWCVGRLKAHAWLHCIIVVQKQIFACWGGVGLVSLLNTMFGLGIVPKETASFLFNLVCWKMFNKSFRDGMFGLSMALEEILFCLFNQFNMKIYLETWLWLSLICAEKAVHQGVDIWDYAKMHLTRLFIFNILQFFYHYYHSVIFIILYLIISIIITWTNVIIIFIIVYH